MKRISLLILCLFCFLQVDAQFTQHGRTLEYHGRQSKTTYTSPVSIAFQGCSSTTNDKAGNLSLVFPNAKAGNVVSCTDLEISNSQYVIFNRNDFDIWTIGDRNLSIVLCKKSKIDSYVAIYTKVQMDVSNAKYEAKKKELYNSEQDKIALKKELEQLTKKHNEEIKEIKANALIFAYIDEEKMDSLQYEQHLCILNNDIKKAVEIGQQIDFKNNMSKQLSNFEASIKKSQEIGLKLFQEAEALYLHIANCELLSIEEDSLKDDYDILIKSYRSLLEQYPNNFKCSEEVYKKTKIKLGNILYKYADKVIGYTSSVYNEDTIKCYMKEAASCNNSDAMLWFVENHENRDTAKVYAKILLEGIESRKLNIPGDNSYYDIKDICNSIPDFKTENKSMVFYYTVLDSNRVSLTHVHCKDTTIRKIRIPEKVIYGNNKYRVTEIGTCVLGENSHSELLLKAGRRFIDDKDFYNNLNFAIKDSSHAAKIKLIIPETITYIGAGAFNPRLSAVLFLLNGIPKNLEILRINSFADCEFNSGEIRIPNKVKEIEEDALPLWWDDDNYKMKYYNIFIPRSLERIDCLDGLSGGNGGNGVGKIMDISNNPNFKLINGALYNADSSYVYLGTIGQYNNLLTITRNLKFDDEFFVRLHFIQLELIIDSISFDDRNPYYSYYDHCIYTKQLDTLLYILPSVDNVRLSAKLKHIGVMDMPSYINYEIPNDMSIEGMKGCLSIFLNGNYEFELSEKKYKSNSNYNENGVSENELLDIIINNNSKLLCLKALLYLEDDKYYQAYNLLDSIRGDTCSQNSDFYTLLFDSCYTYRMRIETYMKEFESSSSINHDQLVTICLKLRAFYNNAADYLNTEVSVYDAFYNNWILGAQESYNSRFYSLSYMEKGIPYALKLVNEFNKNKYKNTVSNFYVSLADVALRNEDESSKALQYANKSLELNPNNVEAYEALANYYFYYGSAEKNKKIKDIIIKVENIAPNYKNSKDNILYQLLDNESIKLIK